MGEVITFYSFKGGVGRSMALANLAALEAQRGKRVLALDFDFEAPGLHRYFLKPGRFAPEGPQRGVLNLFAALRDDLRLAFPAGHGLQNADAPSRLRALVAKHLRSSDYIYTVQLDDPNSREPRQVAVDFIPAARFDGTYSELVRSFDWQRFYDDYAELFPALVSELGSRYDQVLVDSRTGVTDIGSICTMALPDKLVLVFSPNEQSLSGALDAGWQAVQGRRETGAPRPLGIFPLVSRVEEGEEQQKRSWIKRARESFEKLAAAAYGVDSCDLSEYFNAIRVPHRGYYAYGERIAAEEQPVNESGSLAEVYNRLADALRCAGVIEAQQGLAPAKKAAERDDAVDVLIKMLEASKLADRPSEAVRVYDDLIPRWDNLMHHAPGAEVPLARAMIARADALYRLSRYKDSVAAYQAVFDRFRESNDPDVQAEVDRATFNLGTLLQDTERYEDASTLYEGLISRFEGRDDPHAEEVHARSLVAKGELLMRQHEYNAAIAIYDQLLHRFSRSRNELMQPLLVRGNASKGTALLALGNTDEALVIFDEIVVRNGESEDDEIGGSVASAWYGKIVVLDKQGHHAQAIEMIDEMLRRFSDAREPELLNIVAAVMVLKCIVLCELGRREEALAVPDELTARVGNVRTPEIEETLAQALEIKRGLLAKADGEVGSP